MRMHVLFAFAVLLVASAIQSVRLRTTARRAATHEHQTDTSEPSDYVVWLRRQGVQLLRAAGAHWAMYRRALVPATAAPCYPQLSRREAKALLRRSGALLLRYSSQPSDTATEWWYILCDRYEPQTFSHKTRQKINRGRRDCRVTLVEPAWLADHGYGCYLAAHSRYTNSVPICETLWRADVLASIGGPIDYWGVFVGEELAGYCKCVIEGECASTTSGKYDPAYFKHRPVNALVSVLAEHYVGKKGLTLCNGNRSVSHDTNMQEFLLDHGFRKQFCHLKVVYRWWVEAAVKLIFPVRRSLASLPQRGLVLQLESLLLQEQIRRACEVAK